MDSWALTTYCFVGISTIAYVVFFIVISVGGIFDLIYLFKSLKAEIIDTSDDGRARNIDD